ncbi:MAG: hypothetical protein AAF628_21585 [Planctomycetota bacterium]
MSLVFLVHWHANELAERAARLERAGFAVDGSAAEGGGAARSIRQRRPNVVVIDLARLPSHGKHLATWLRENKTTAATPLVLVADDAKRREAAKAQFPDAIHTTWRGIKGAVGRALATPPKSVPSSTPGAGSGGPGYSGTPLPKKLGIKAGAALTLLGAPEDFEQTLGALPEAVAVRRQARGAAHVVVLFARRARDLEQRLGPAQRIMADGARLWIAWPKQASGVATDLDGNAVRHRGLETGLVDIKVCAIDAVWSGLCFTRRRAGTKTAKTR